LDPTLVCSDCDLTMLVILSAALTAACSPVTLITGILVVAGFQAFFSTFYLVALLTTAASEIPITSSRWLPSPLNHPYFCTSIASFWSKGWHTNFRRPFMLFAYLPMLRFSNLVGLLKRAGRVLAIVATFALSGLLHELILSGQVSPFYQHDLHVRYGHTYLGDQSEAVQGQYGMGTNNYGTTYAFAIQGVFVVLEDLWLNCIETKVVKLLAGGRKEQSGQGHIITGLWRSALGWLWMMGCMMYSGSILVNVSVVPSVSRASSSTSRYSIYKSRSSLSFFSARSG
jgi:hypothetical protein